jgi:hypothetical protein
LLSFAHGANDVANAIGPLAAIYASVTEGGIVSVARIPPWILLIGALGIATGLLLYGPKLIRTVGSKITKLNRIRAFCVTLSAAITVIIASALGTARQFDAHRDRRTVRRRLPARVHGEPADSQRSRGGGARHHAPESHGR